MNIQISNGMYVALLINVVFAKAIGVTQGVIAREVGQDMWIATLLATLQGVVMIYITYIVIRRASHRDFMATGELLLGRWFGKIVVILIFAFFIGAFAPIMITFVYHLQEYFLPDAPVSLFIILALLVGSIGCYYGLEVMARTALFGVLFIYLLNGLILAGSFREFDIKNLLPVLESGFVQTFESSVAFDADWAIATMTASLLLPFVKDVKKHGAKLSVTAIIATGLLVISWSILEGAVLSAEVTGNYTVSCMKLARNAHIGTFLQRYEMVMIAFYSVSALVQVMMCVYGSSMAAARLFGLTNSKRMILPVAVILGVFSDWIVRDHFRAMDYLEQYWPMIALPIAVGLPLLLLILQALFRKKLDSALSKQGA
ncbi:spore germination protein [Paenibacillus curdlanolyticus YK9]|uniref:Spore germination protein n=1 Tax=Paenibacillus curdlanolyticus YK9 TaxID=717606 RepID=E0IA27_9BACL|nr:GerAB/ArcD/ProY family transporter [Paenibacillus curdlanolyticus]EFM10604.1 spore germination protein [Paenibacillus curdlanolyticus YK9]